MSYLKHVRVIAPLTVFLVVLTVAATVGHGLVHASSLTLVSGPSPYASCPNTSQTGTNYGDAEVEPWVTVNPVNPLNIVGIWQQDR